MPGAELVELLESSAAAEANSITTMLSTLILLCHGISHCAFEYMVPRIWGKMGGSGHQRASSGTRPEMAQSLLCVRILVIYPSNINRNDKDKFKDQVMRISI